MRDVSSGDLPVGVISDRRRAERARVKVDCQAVTDEDFVLLGETIVDLSDSGCLLRADGVCADVGERVIVSFKPPHSAVWIDAEATIVRLINGKQPLAPAFALSLEGLNGFEREVLKGAVTRVSRPTSRTKRRRRRVERLRARRGYVNPDAVAAQPLVSVRDAVTALPSLRKTPSAPRRERPLPAAVLGRIDLEKKAVPRDVAAKLEDGLPRSLWRSEAPRPSKDSVVVVRRGYKRPLPRIRLQSTEAAIEPPKPAPAAPPPALSQPETEPQREFEEPPPQDTVFIALPVEAGLAPVALPILAPTRTVVVGATAPGPAAREVVVVGASTPDAEGASDVVSERVVVVS